MLVLLGATKVRTPIAVLANYNLSISPIVEKVMGVPGGPVSTSNASVCCPLIGRLPSTLPTLANGCHSFFTPSA